MPDQDTLIASGNEALGHGAWTEARALFEQALALAESAGANEGLSWATWWLNDGQATIGSRKEAYGLYRRAEDDIGAARMAMWLASDYDDFYGEHAIARGWRRRARRLLDGYPLCADHGWLSILEGDAALLMEDDNATARRCAAEATATARHCGIADMEMLALAMEGLALVGEGDVDAGMKRLDEAAASVMGGEVKDEAWAVKILCYLIYGCERGRDFDRAAQWCDKLRAIADRLQFTFAQGTCRAHYAGVLMSRGRWKEAEEQLARSAEFLEASRPPWATEALVRLAELRRRQGRFDEAAELLSRAERHPSALLGLAEIALDTGRPQDATELVERFLRALPETNRLQRAAALEIMIRVAALSTRRDHAAEALAELWAISEQAQTQPLRAAALFSSAMMAVANSEHDDARASLEDAVDLFERCRTPYEAARARLELAGVLASLDRVDRARAEADAARATFDVLGASFSSRRAATLLRNLEHRAAPAEQPLAPVSPLTARQAEILRLVSEGRSDREIAASLSLSEHTVHRHVANILMRLDLPTRAAATANAAARGLI